MALTLRSKIASAEKGEDKTRFSLYLDPVIIRILKEKADLEGRSLNNYITRVLAKHALVDLQKA